MLELTTPASVALPAKQSEAGKAVEPLTAIEDASQSKAVDPEMESLR